ncbi:TPA: hypothetical protein ACPZM8_004259 [Yersinia enterocolitica]
MTGAAFSFLEEPKKMSEQMPSPEMLESLIFNHAADTASLLVSRGVCELDRLFGEGYAAANPVVLNQWVAVASTMQLAQLQINAANGLACQMERIGALADAMEASAAAAYAGRMQ